MKIKMSVFVKFSCLILILMELISWPGSSFALHFPLPSKGNNVVGEVFTIRSQPGDNFDSISRRYDVGFFELKEANPELNPDAFPFGTSISIPSRFILPPGKHEGIVINLAELRLYYYPPNRYQIFTYPIGIGNIGEVTPTGHFTIIQKMKNPTWKPPFSVRKKYLARGIDLPDVVAAGPKNPLGNYAMRLNQWSYLIHGTNTPASVGKRSSAGCIHLFPEDIEELFQFTDLKTRVTIINSAYKVAWDHEKLYIEIEQPLSEQAHKKINLTPLTTLINKALGKQKANIDWKKAEDEAVRKSGIPLDITQTPVSSFETNI